VPAGTSAVLRRGHAPRTRRHWASPFSPLLQLCSCHRVVNSWCMVALVAELPAGLGRPGSLEPCACVALTRVRGWRRSVPGARSHFCVGWEGWSKLESYGLSYRSELGLLWEWGEGGPGETTFSRGHASGPRCQKPNLCNLFPASLMVIVTQQTPSCPVRRQVHLGDGVAGSCSHRC
jgi:hypothetical protein